MTSWLLLLVQRWCRQAWPAVNSDDLDKRLSLRLHACCPAITIDIWLINPLGNCSTASNNTLAVDGWAVTFGTAMRGLSGAAARPGPSSLQLPNVTPCPSTASISITVLPCNGLLLCGLMCPLRVKQVFDRTIQRSFQVFADLCHALRRTQVVVKIDVDGVVSLRRRLLNVLTHRYIRTQESSSEATGAQTSDK